MLARCSRRWMTAWLTLQHILVILPVVRAQRDAASQGSFVAAIMGLVIVAIIIILAVGCSQRCCRRTAAKASDCLACNNTGCGLCGSQDQEAQESPPCMACGNTGCGLCGKETVPQVEQVSCVACGNTGCGLCGVKAAEPIATSSELKVMVPSHPPEEEEAIDRGPSSSVCNFSNPPTPSVPRLFVFQTPSKICSGRVEHI